MSVFNGAQHLGSALESILKQTYPNFELLVIDDGSIDSTREVLRNFGDPRLIVVENGRNLGLIASLNKGLELARGEFVARMDADDICHHDRFKIQMAYLTAHPDVGVCGTWYWRTDGRSAEIVRLPTNPAEVRASLLFDCPMAHPTVMFRRKLLLDERLRYDRAYPHAEDYHLWASLATKTALVNIPRPLLYYRVHKEQVTVAHAELQRASADIVRLEELTRFVPEASAEDVALHLAVAHNNFARDPATLCRIEAWLNVLDKANSRMGLITAEPFRSVIRRVWQRACLLCMPTWWALTIYARSPLVGERHRGLEVSVLLAKSLKRLAHGSS